MYVELIYFQFSNFENPTVGLLLFRGCTMLFCYCNYILHCNNIVAIVCYSILECTQNFEIVLQSVWLHSRVTISLESPTNKHLNLHLYICMYRISVGKVTRTQSIQMNSFILCSNLYIFVLLNNSTLK